MHICVNCHRFVLSSFWDSTKFLADKFSLTLLSVTAHRLSTTTTDDWQLYLTVIEQWVHLASASTQVWTTLETAARLLHSFPGTENMYHHQAFISNATQSWDVEKSHGIELTCRIDWNASGAQQLSLTLHLVGGAECHDRSRVLSERNSNNTDPLRDNAPPKWTDHVWTVASTVFPVFFLFLDGQN